MTSRLRYALLLVPLFALHASAAHAGFIPAPAEYTPAPFDTPPTAMSATSITMTSKTVTYSDINGTTYPVTYYFSSVGCDDNNGTGGTNSGNQDSPTYVDTGLQPNHCYGYQADVYSTSDGSSTGNSSTTMVYTLANTPGAPTVTPLSGTTALLSNDENGNPASDPTTLFLMIVTPASTFDFKYVNASGALTTTPTYLSDLALDGLTVTGLSPSTTYWFISSAVNQDGEFSSSSLPTTVTMPTDSGGGDDGGGGIIGGLIQRVFRLGGNLRVGGGIRLY